MFGHPAGLRTLFFTELWERFSFYGLRALLILFLTASVADGGLGYTAATAGAIYGLYTAFVYLSGLPGGWIADRILGQRDAVFIGGIIIAAGHFTMALPSTTTFFLGLLLVVIGTGLLKPNVSAIVGDLYPEGGARRDAGFSIFYMGINVGAFAGPLVCGWLGESVDWHLGFGAAGVGMIAGLIQYKMGIKDLGDAGTITNSTTEDERNAAKSQLWKALAGSAVVIAAVWGMQSSGILNMTLEGVANSLGVGIVGLAVLYFAYILILGNYNTQEKKRIVVIFFLFVGAALFWSGFEQAGSSLNLFARDLTDRNMFGWLVPASWLQSVNALFIIMFAPIFGWLWVWLGSREPSIPMKFAYGLILLGGGFFVMAWAATHTSGGNMVGPSWLVVTYFLHTAGELCLSPVGLSSVTKLAPKNLVGQMMGVWFMGTALGNLVAGILGGMFDSLPLPELFGSVAWVSVGAGIFFLVMTIPLKKLIGELK